MGCVNEQTVQDLVSGRLRGEALGNVEVHLAECTTCAALVAIAGSERSRSASSERSLPLVGTPEPPAARPEAPPARAAQPSLAQGTMVGHYVVLGFLGAGGMGEVYAAYDPNLERKVAIKFLRPELIGRREHEVAAERMRREARLVAKLSHPNVVVVYQIGVWGDRLFIAMEHIDGQSVSEWLRAAPRSVAEILPVFLGAGAGLAAAHAAGVVHRDFKPHNVMLAKTGEVRVMDFGLAHLDSDASASDAAALAVAETAEPGAGGIENAAQEAVNDPEERLTRTGALLGTPAYMAPEQLRGARVTARADQYSFCVALYEALNGKRPPGPFSPPSDPNGGKRQGGSNGGSNVGSKRDGAASAPSRSVPASLRRVLKRGLATDPEQRYPSMDELLADLATRQTRRRRLGVGAAALAVLATIGVAGALANRSARRVLFCRGYEARASAVWPFNEAAEPVPAGTPRALSDAFARSGVTGASEIFARVGRTLSTYLKEWSSQANDACEATHVRGEQSREELGLRLACLDERLAAAHALTDALAGADARVVQHAADAVSSLPDLGRCSQLVLLRAAAKPPEGAAKQQTVARLRRRMDELKLLAGTGHFESVAGDLRALQREIKEADYPPLLADFDMLVLTNLWANGGVPEHEPEMIREALRAAAASGYEEAMANALVGLVGVEYRSAPIADLAFQQADAVLQHLGDPSELRGWLETNYSMTLYARGRLHEAIDHAERSLALKRRRTPLDGRDLAASQSNVCVYRHAAGQTAAALPVCEQAVGLSVAEVGWGHPQTMNALENQADVLTDLGRFGEGCPMAQRVYDFFQGIGERPEGRTALMLAFGRCALGDQRASVARDYFQRALIEATASSATEMELAEIERHLARALLEAGEPVRAAELTERAAVRYEALPELAFRAAEARTWLAEHRHR
jgi:serine/threonine protein kinase/tetratricopeptide (TPR) repeat protein